MFSFKSLFFISLASATLMAQAKIDVGSIKGDKIVLKDKAGAELELNKDSKVNLEITSTGVDKLVLKNQMQVRLWTDKQEVIYDVVQTVNTSERNKENFGRIEYKGKKEDNKQDLNIKCIIRSKVLTENVKYDKGFVACIKTANCKGYVLQSDKKFRVADTGSCIGKKEVEKSTAAVDIEESLMCWLYDNDAKEDPKEMNKFIGLSRSRGIEKEIDIKPNTNECK